MEGPSAANGGMTDMEWLEREQEKEMIELAMERSLNEFQAFQNSQPGLQTTGRSPLRQPMHNSMPAMHHTYNGHYSGGSRRDITISNHGGDQHQFQHRMHERDRMPNRRATYNTNRPDAYSGRYGAGPRENSLRNLGTTGASPVMQRPLAPMGYPRSGSFREVQEVTETVIDSPHGNYDRSSAVFHDRRHPSGPLHQQYDYRVSNAANSPFNMGGQPPAFEQRRVSTPAQYHEQPPAFERSVSAPLQHHDQRIVPPTNAPARYHDRGVVPPNNMSPNMRTPRHEARAAVLETARRHLSDDEALRVEEALNLAIGSQNHSGVRESRQQAHTDTQHSNGSSSTFESSHHSHHTGRSGASRSHLSPEEQRQLEEALYASRIDNVPSHERRPSLHTQETMDLLRRASAAEYLSQEELDQIERSLEDNNIGDHGHNDNRHYHHPHSQRDHRHQPHHHPRAPPPPSIQQHHHPHAPPPPSVQHPHHHAERQHEHLHDRPYQSVHHERQHERQDDRPYHTDHLERQHERQEHLHDRHLDRPPQRDRRHHSEQREQRHVPQVPPQPPLTPQPPLPPQARGYRPNPRFAATTLTTPRRTYSGDSVALAREEIQKAVAANTLSKEEYAELMMALSGNNDSKNSNDNNNSTESPGAHVDDDNKDEVKPIEESEGDDRRVSLGENEANDADHVDKTVELDVPPRTPAGDSRQTPRRSASFDSISDRHGRLRNHKGLADRTSMLPPTTHEGGLARVLVVDDAEITYMCPPFPESDARAESRSNESDQVAQETPQRQENPLDGEPAEHDGNLEVADKRSSGDPAEAESKRERRGLCHEDEPENEKTIDNEEAHSLEETQDREENENLEVTPEKEKEAPRYEVSDDDDPRDKAEELATGSNKSEQRTEYDASQRPEESASSSPRTSRRVSEGALPPSNRGANTRLGNSHHSLSQSRHSRRSNPTKLSAALAALPYARSPPQGAPGSVSLDLEYSVSQFGDSVGTFGSDLLGQQKGEGSAGSIVSSETDSSRQNQGSTFSPLSLSSQTVRGVGLLPSPLGDSAHEEEEGEVDVLQEAPDRHMGASKHPDDNRSPENDRSEQQVSETGTTADAELAESLVDEKGHAGASTDDGETEKDQGGGEHLEENSISVDSTNITQADVNESDNLSPLDRETTTPSSDAAAEEGSDYDQSMHRNSEDHIDMIRGEDRDQQISAEIGESDEPLPPNRSLHEHLDVDVSHEEPAEELEADAHRQRPPEWGGMRVQEPRHREHEMIQERPSEHELEPGRPSRDDSDDLRRYEMQHEQDEHPRMNRNAFSREVDNEYYQQHRQHWGRHHRRNTRGESDRFDARLREERLREEPNASHEREPERDYFRQRQHHSSRRLGRSESDPFERQRRNGGPMRKRRSEAEASDVPKQVQVDPRNLREAWAAGGRSSSVSSLGESTQYSIYSAHFRNAEDYDRYRNEDYERALYEHNNWRQSNPTPLPHSMREPSNAYGGSDYTGSSRKLHQPTSNHSRGFRREAECDRERPRPVEPISDHDRFDEDLKRALYESMQMQRNSQPQREDEYDYDDDLQDRVDPHEHRLSREKMEHINRALSGADCLEDERQSTFDRFGPPLNQFPSDRYAADDTAGSMVRDTSDPTHNRIPSQQVRQNDAPTHPETMVLDLQATRLADDALDRALQEAKNEEERQSLLLAHQLQQEDERRASRTRRNQGIAPRESLPQSADAVRVGAVVSTSPLRGRHPLEAEMTPHIQGDSERVPSTPIIMRPSAAEPSRRSLEESYSSLQQSRSSLAGAVHSSSPERVRHPLEESYSSVEQRRSSQVGAIRTCSPDQVRHPLEESYSSFDQGRARQVGAVRSSSPDRARHPLEDSFPSPRRQGSVERLRQSLDESQQPPSQSNRFDESHGSIFSSRYDHSRRQLDDSHSSQITPSHPENIQQDTPVMTPPTQDRTADLSDGRPGQDSSPPEREINSGAAQQDMAAFASPQAKKRLIKDSLVSPSKSPVSPVPQGGKKGKESRRDSKVLGSVARLGKKGVTSLMQTIKLGSARKMGSNQNSSGGLPSLLSEPPPPPIQQMDLDTRVQVDRAISKGIMSQLNGVVKLGREATIFHAEKGSESHGFDVAVKVYKRAQGRGSDQADELSQFQNISSREQLELWTIKEFRNLKRARRAGVPSPLPLLTKNNILFMQFMGSGGRPAPQLGELDLRRGHKRWKNLYKQIVEAIRRLFTSALLVHGDLNESNVLVVPRHFIDATVTPDSKEYEADTAVLIDFGQTVDSKHPDALDMLRRDVQHIRQFFVKQGVRTPSVDDALQFITNGSKSTPEHEDSTNKASFASL